MKAFLQSKYTSRKVTPAQRIAEIMCERMAARSGESLQHRFWSTDKWQQPFCLQVLYANALLKLYSYQAILAALANEKSTTVYSLKNPILPKIIEEEQASINKLTNQKIEVDGEAKQSRLPFEKYDGLINKL